MRHFIALIHKEAGSDYGVSFPDLPGCVTAGRTVAEARRMAREALALHLEGLSKQGLDIPQPSPLQAIMAAPDYRGAMKVRVPVPA